MIRNKLIYLLLLISNLFFGQTWQWARSGDVNASGEGLAVATDLNGNAFITGEFTSSTIFFGTYTLTNVGGNNTYLVKYNPTGNVIWAKSIGGDSRGEAISTDASGNVFITGFFYGPTIIFGTYTLTNSGQADIYVAKFDANGNVLWAKRGGGIWDDGGYGLCTDGNGNVLITGVFTSSVITFGTYTLTNGGATTFVVKYDSNGNVLWAQNNSVGAGYSISTDANNNVFITGSGALIYKYNSNGNLIWTHAVISGGGYGISADITGNIFVTGYFNTPTIIFGTYTLTNAGSTQMFLAKYDTNGNVIWATSAAGNSNVVGYSVSTYTGGVFVSGSILNPGTSASLGAYTFAPTSNDNMFIAKYDLNGNILYATSLTGGGDDNNAVRVDKFCNAYISGDFGSDTLIIGADTLTLIGGENIFLAKLSFTSECQPLPDGISHISNPDSQISISPNPNSGSFKIQIDNEIKNGELILINSLGQKVFEQKIIQGISDIETTGLSAGLYNCILLEDKRQKACGKIVVER